jgi:hypothetical protein
LWFFATYRYQMNRQTVASMWDNSNAGDNTKWTYDPDFSKPSEDDGEWRNHSVRLTWQAERRLAEMQTLGGAAEVQRLGQHDDVPKVTQLHPGGEAYGTGLSAGRSVCRRPAWGRLECRVRTRPMCDALFRRRRRC